MTIGYIITAHALPHHLVRLVRRLETEGARFFVHFDRRAAPEDMEVVERELGGASNVRLVPRHKVHWGNFSQVDATLEGVYALLDDPAGVDYGVLLTGQDYPLRPAGVIERTFEEANGRSFMSYWRSEGHYLERVNYRHWHRTVLGRHVRVPNRFVPLWIKRPFPAGLEPFTGWANWCLSRECLELVRDFVARRPEVVAAFRGYAHPLEAFFQTIVMNSPLADTVTGHNVHYIDWSKGGASPRLLTMADLEPMLASDDLFARKFDPQVDPDVLDALDASIDAAAAAETAG